MAKVKSEELIGSALLWAVCCAIGYSPVIAATGIAYQTDLLGSWVYPQFTSDSAAGELMSAEWIGVERPSRGQKPPVWRAIADSKMPAKPHEYCGAVVSAYGESLGIAVCRALVLSRLGTLVEIPEELLLQAVPA